MCRTVLCLKNFENVNLVGNNMPIFYLSLVDIMYWNSSRVNVQTYRKIWVVPHEQRVISEWADVLKINSW